MILDELVLHNFGVYRGQQKIALAPQSKKPVVLFGGLNGVGKTTLLDGLQLALFGKNAQCSNRGPLAYLDYLDRCVNSQASKSDGAAVKIQFRHRSAGNEQEIRVHRSWSATKSGALRERLQVLRNGEEDRALTDAWSEHVDEFMPAGISHLFLFDGEKIEGLADVESSSRLLSTAIGSLLGLDLVDQLSTDLVVLERRQRASFQGEEERRAVDAAELEVTSLEEKISALKDARARAENEIHIATAALRRIETRFKKEGGDIYERRTQLESEKGSAQEVVTHLETELRELAAGILPIAIVGPALSAVIDQDTREVDAAHATALGQVLEKRDARLSRDLRKRGVDKSVAAWVAKHLAEDRAERAQGAVIECFITLSSDARQVLQSVPTLLDKTQERARSLIERLESKRLEAERIERRLASVPTPDAIRGLQHDRQEARARLEAARGHADSLDSELQKAARTRDTQKARLVRLIEKKVKEEFANEHAIRIVRHARRVRKTLGEFRERLVERHVRRIEQLILESFRRLLRKETLVSSLTIDPQTFSVHLRDRMGKPLSATRLSAGERQLLAVSMLWGLARASGRPLPAVIDTPLGRLDSTHRSHLVNRYIPFASHQVLLLSTDEEINKGYLDQLRPHIGRSYLLEYDDKQGATSVRKGYFWEQ